MEHLVTRLAQRRVPGYLNNERPGSGLSSSLSKRSLDAREAGLRPNKHEEVTTKAICVETKRAAIFAVILKIKQEE